MQKHKFRFERLIINRSNNVFKNLKYFPKVFGLYVKYLDKLEDDFSSFKTEALAAMVDFIEKTSPHFYPILCDEEFCGFVVLERFIGNYSAEITTCFEPKFWGDFTKIAGIAFMDFCFNELKLKKVKALVYPQNSRVRALLKACGFKKETLLKNETIKDGFLQDIEIFSAYAPSVAVGQAVAQNRFYRERL